MKRTLLTILVAGSLVSAQAAIFEYTVSLTPAPGVTTSGSGSGTATYDDVARTLALDVSWSGLTLGTTVSHIHLPTVNPFDIGAGAGVVLTPTTLPGFPSGLTSGNYNTVLDMSSSATYPAAFIMANGNTTEGAETAVISAFDEGRAYWNIHTSFAPSGEINGFMVLVPEPSTFALFGLAGAALAFGAWRKRRAQVS